MRSKTIEKLYLPFTLCIIGVLTFILTYNISLGEYTDFYVHTQRANDFWAGTRQSDYPVFYISYGIIRGLSGMADLWATAYAQTFFVLLCAITVYIISGFAIPSLSSFEKCLITLFMTFFGPIYIGGVHYYLGVGSFNTWHSPTNTCVKFLALFIFFLFSYLYQNFYENEIILKAKSIPTARLLVILSLLIFISPLFKPSFYQVFAPTVFLIVVFDFIRGRISIKDSLKWAAVLLPALFLVVFQAYQMFRGGNDFYSGHSIVIAPFKVWSFWCVIPIPVAIILAIAFPLFTVFFCNDGVGKDKTFIFAFVFYFVSVLEYSLLSETVDWESGNFGWGMNLAIGILFLSSLFHFIRYLQANRNNKSKKFEITSFTGFSLLSLHFIWGSWYYWKLLFSGSLGCF